ncbi:hypothetical protein P280DRAFT_510669 [Massarina eburnea CBS 473.64]|uniref:IBR domain-containing protein n=1 Tax=Massarina eburnea CBS 473.64 TaxID=1395130 RepID=A0A6A6RKQ0_9PLEO|nr:hypothetical protein P280DRAFT_510669 [Massarina eburnea CBS 473.64]
MFAKMPEGNRPPKCCGSIPLSQEARKLLMEAFFTETGRLRADAPELQSKLELTTEPVHCAKFREWAEDLGQTNHEDKAIVCNDPSCGVETCLLCGNVANMAHVDGECAKDPQRLEMERLREQGLAQKRPHCNRWTLRIDGCNHMVGCGKSFCFVRGKPWHLCFSNGRHMTASGHYPAIGHNQNEVDALESLPKQQPKAGTNRYVDPTKYRTTMRGTAEPPKA